MRQIAVLVLLVVAFVAALVVATSGGGDFWRYAWTAVWGALMVRQVVVVWREARDRGATGDGEGVPGEG